MSAVASAAPSISPTASTEMPSVVTMKTGRRLWISSDETSISKLTKPRTQTLAGKRETGWTAAFIRGTSGQHDGGSPVRGRYDTDLVHRLARGAQRGGHGAGLGGIDHHHHADA